MSTSIAMNEMAVNPAHMPSPAQAPMEVLWPGIYVIIVAVAVATPEAVVVTVTIASVVVVADTVVRDPVCVVKMLAFAAFDGVPIATNLD